MKSEETTRRTSRLAFLRRGAVIVGGAAGMAALSGKAEGAQPLRGTRTLHGRGWHASVPGKRFGHAPDAGQTFHVHGELVDKAGGSVVGEFVGAVSRVESPFASSAHGSVGFEHHVLHLRDGAIFATGHSVDGEGSFAIVGGTGSYAGARGSYLARQSVHGLGGDGTATITITIT